jgi:murein DD-endopeptidase MepM/ murein hydrolase activator NlpD
MPEFNVDVPGDSKTPLVDKFWIINNKLRKINYETTMQACRDTDNVLYWDGKFKRLPRSANRAGFADRRTYKYNEKIIDHQTHLGVDLASVAHSPVPASNRGKVVFMDYLGIYGKTIILDHGFGLFSMYSHLSSYNLNVKKDKIVSKGEIIGNTGVTGLAGGDHLHFGMLVHKTFVNPVEWWDAGWIDNNIMSKIRTVQAD